MNIVVNTPWDALVWALTACACLVCLAVAVGISIAVIHAFREAHRPPLPVPLPDPTTGPPREPDSRYLREIDLDSGAPVNRRKRNER